MNKIKFQKSKFFIEDFILIGNWNVFTAKSFVKLPYLAADTETKLYYNNENISDETAYNLYKKYGQKWFKMNIEVRAYAFTLSDGENFILFQNCEDFLTFCAMAHTKIVFWYNAKFDFSIFDYYFLSNNWKDTTETIKDKKRISKLPDKTFQSLNGEFGQRYQMRIWKKYLNCNSVEKVHNFKMLDICNLFGGGLAKNLEDWDIEDYHGNKVRKLSMRYDSGDIIEDIQYMINDVKGLYLLAEKIDKTLFEITGFSLFKAQYLTAGGLAKKTMLKYMFNRSNRENIMLFKDFFPLSIEEDKDFRYNSLYHGGKCLINPDKVGKIQHKIYKFDVNSMYPDKFRNMLYPIGKPKKVKKFREGYIYIIKVENICGILKQGKIPIWQDSLSGDYVDFIQESEEHYFWKEELEEYENWYDLSYDIIDILEYKGMYFNGAKKYVDTFYDIKCNSKGCIKNGAKLLLNSAYGKLAQRVERQFCTYELVENTYVHLKKGEIEEDESGMLSVVVGSRITALAAVSLMKYIRDICGENTVNENFIYCDTDSVHSLVNYNNCDNKQLGKMKNEGVFDYGLYLAPKSYVLYNGKYEVHTKGVNTKVVKETILKECKSFEDIKKVFVPNRTFKCLCGLNVKGGKALFYIDKMIVNDENLAKIVNEEGDIEEVNDEYDDD